MDICLQDFHFSLEFRYQKQGVWIPVPEKAYGGDGFRLRDGGSEYYAQWSQTPQGLSFTMGFSSERPTQLRFYSALLREEAYYPVIPCNILGDNHAREAKPGEYPLLTYDHPEVSFCSPFWEFRADRAAAPISAMCCKGGAAALYIQPYSALEDGQMGEYCHQPQHGAFLRNGVFTALPDVFGVSLGYTNDPVTFQNRSTPGASTRNTACRAQAQGMLIVRRGNGREALHQIVRQVYGMVHSRARYQNSFEQAAQGLLDTFVDMNFDRQAGEYCNMNCKPPGQRTMRPWRHVVEIGWTGGAVLAYPMVLSREVLGGRAGAALGRAMSGEAILDRIAAGFNSKSGLLFDLMAPADESGSRLNGWWTGYGLVRDCHCAYTVGSALHYMLKTMMYYKEHGAAIPADWLTCCRNVLDTVAGLQRSDGAFGYTYSASERRVLDWSGFAGCWFVPSLVYLWRLTEIQTYLDAAEKAVGYYQQFVRQLNCFGTPMDTWKSVDEEGNLAFIRGCRLLHEYTHKPEYLEYLKLGAEYEYLWRYAYASRPEHVPIRQEWNSCGGSVTSISNPHIHPMGVIVDSDLYYLGRITGDGYYTSRAMDSTAWMMQCLELYPQKTKYGRYGVLSERWCPSDGLTVERDSDGRAYSSWFSYNLWAAACVFEAVCERALEDESGGEK